MIREINQENYVNEVEKAEGLVLVEFWGPTCKQCLSLMPFVQELSNKYAGKLKVTKVDASKHKSLCVKQKVMSLPTFILYKDGKEVSRKVGREINQMALEKLISENLSN